MGLGPRPYDEKRDFIRVPVECDVNLQLTNNGKHFRGLGKNLSANGVLFFTDELLKPGDKLEMHIEASQKLVSVLDASIEVVRVEATGDGLSWAVGSTIRTLHDAQ